MKVFMCKREGGFSGGLAVVAANSAEEAFKTFFEEVHNRLDRNIKTGERGIPDQRRTNKIVVI